MTSPPKLYLAGPEVFLPNARDIGRAKKELCAHYGFEGHYPFDNEIDASAGGEPIDRLIYRANVETIKKADGAIFNLTPFRGCSADVGTVFELGYAIALGKAAFAYTNDPRDLLERMKEAGAARFDTAKNQWFDADGWLIENFGNADNLMIDASLAEQGDDRLVRPKRVLPLDDLTGFIECLERAGRHFGLARPRR